jgi:hypothetical protein
MSRASLEANESRGSSADAMQTPKAPIVQSTTRLIDRASQWLTNSLSGGAVAARQTARTALSVTSARDRASSDRPGNTAKIAAAPRQAAVNQGLAADGEAKADKSARAPASASSKLRTNLIYR